MEAPISAAVKSDAKAFGVWRSAFVRARARARARKVALLDGQCWRDAPILKPQFRTSGSTNALRRLTQEAWFPQAAAFRSSAEIDGGLPIHFPKNARKVLDCRKPAL